MVKKHSRVIFITVLIIVGIVIAFIIFSGAQPNQGAVPGVKAGDEFIYSIKGFWSSTDPNTPMPENFVQLNMTEWYKITVTEVDGPHVSIEVIWRFANGTEFTGRGSVNVESGIYSPIEGFWAIYGTNLRANDRTRPLGPDRATVNETLTRNYAGGARETNRVSLIREYYDANDPTFSTTWTEYINIYFDRKTGMLVELIDRSTYTNPQQTLSIVWTVKDTNVWAIS